MTIKRYLWLMLAITMLCWAGWLLVLFFINPDTTSLMGFLMFYLSLFFALTGTLALLSYLFRLIFTRINTKVEKVQISFRQAIFWSIVIVISLLLQSSRLLNWLNTLFLVSLVTFIEFLFISLKKDGTENQTT